jgi:hypothetical protein
MARLVAPFVEIQGLTLRARARARTHAHTHTHTELSRHVKIRIYKTIILSVVLYGFETWSLILREEHGLRSFRTGC